MLSEQIKAKIDRELKKYPANQKQSAVDFGFYLFG